MGIHSSYDVGNLQGLVSSHTSSKTIFTLKLSASVSTERLGGIVVLLCLKAVLFISLV